MKKCPECGRGYNDDSLSYCLDDGSELLFGPASADEPLTAILHEASTPDEAATLAQIPTTRQTSIHPSGDTDVSKGKRVDKRLWIVPIVLVISVLGVFAAYHYLQSDRSGPITSIAVLPLQNKSGDPSSEYLSDGLAESLIYRLSQLPDLRVSPTSSVIQYKGKDTKVAAVANELGVDAVMTGRLAQIGDNLTISIELVDVRNNKLLWGEQYERKMSELLTTQREIAATIADRLKLRLSGDGSSAITKRYTESDEAYRLYLQGRFHFAKRSGSELVKSIAAYEKAIQLDPKYALAYAAIADSYNSLAKNPNMPPAEVVPKAKAAAQRALELDPDLAEAHTALGDSIAIYDWDWALAERHLKRSLELNPNVSYTHLVYGMSVLAPLGRTDESLERLNRALELEPASPITNAIMVTALVYARQYDKAVAQAQKTVELDPNFQIGHFWLITANLTAGRTKEAGAAVNDVMTQFGNRPPHLYCQALTHAIAGDRTAAEASLVKLREAEKHEYVRKVWAATVYAALGDKNAAFAELERAKTEKDAFLPRIKSDPFFDPLRDDPRYRDLLRRMDLPE